MSFNCPPQLSLKILYINLPNKFRYLRSLRFNHMDLNPTFCCSTILLPKRNGKVVQGNRRIRIVCQKFTASEPCLEDANSIMIYLEENKVQRCLLESPFRRIEKMFSATMNYTSGFIWNTKYCRMEPRPRKFPRCSTCLIHKMALLPDLILLKRTKI